MSEETKCSIEGCEEERVESRRVCKEHYNEAQRRNREGKLKPGKKPGKKAVKKPSVHELEKARIEAQYDATHPPARAKKQPEVNSENVTVGDIEELVTVFTNGDEEDEAYPLAAVIWGYLYGKGLVT